MVNAMSGKRLVKLENRINCVKYTLFCFNVISWIVGASMFGLSVWLKAEPGFQEWVDMLKIHDYYAGVYILILASVVVMIVSFVGCCSALMESTGLLMIYASIQVLSFLLGMFGAGALLHFSTMNSALQPLIRDRVRDLIARSTYPGEQETLKLIQENIACCGADGPMDYMHLRQPLPSECRDSVTGHAFFHGCVDEITWFVQDKSAWCAGLGMVLCMMHVVNAVMSIVLIQAIKKEEEEARNYRR
ncbi:tetraspanin-2A [Ctenocephalides felis]|uniref:tetraspanin-2A n=1 Tax=Ctenocephalides felis TaxID=7515 RepID=UPI000E6E1048|nr:tetraspanin-2A [Ctenocephalides felis]